MKPNKKKLMDNKTKFLDIKLLVLLLLLLLLYFATKLVT
jgi:hypothetical protein